MMIKIDNPKDVDKLQNFKKDSYFFNKLTGEALKNLRKQIGLSQEEFSKATGISRGVLTNLETAKNSLTYPKLMMANDCFNEYIENNHLPFPKNYFVMYLIGLTKKNTPLTSPEKIIDFTKTIEEKELLLLFGQLSQTDQNKILERMKFIISTYDDEEQIPTKVVPLIGWTACGNPIEAIENNDEYIETNELKASFALSAKGDSMAPLIDDGDILLIKETSNIEVGEIGIFQINETGFSDDEEVTCKLLKSIKNNIMTLVPLNPTHDPIVVNTKQNQVKVIGKYLSKITN